MLKSNKIIATFLFLICLLANSGYATENRVKGIEDIDRLVLNSNPSIKSLIDAYRAGTLKPKEVSTLPDPMVHFGLNNFPFSAPTFSNPMTGEYLGISQLFITAGKLGLLGEIETIAASVLKEFVLERLNSLVTQVRSLVLDANYLNEAIAITDENILILKDLLKMTEAAYKTGKGLLQDVEKTKVWLTKMKDRKIEYIRRLNDILYDISRLTLSHIKSVPQVDDLNNILVIKEIDPDRLFEFAMNKRPAYRASVLMVERQKKMLDLAKKEYYPDVSFGIRYTQRSRNPDFLSLNVALTLPVYYKTKQAVKVERMSKLLSSFRKNSHDILVEIKREIQSGVTDFLEYKKRKDLYEKTLLPSAYSAYESALSSYKSSKVDFLNVINSLIVYMELKIRNAEVVYKTYKARVRIDGAVGGPAVRYKDFLSLGK